MIDEKKKKKKTKKVRICERFFAFSYAPNTVKFSIFFLENIQSLEEMIAEKEKSEKFCEKPFAFFST